MGEDGALVANGWLAGDGANEGKAGGGRFVGAGDAAGLPEVGVDGAVAGVEEARHLTEVLVLLPVLLGVDSGAGASEFWILEGGGDVGGSEHAGGEGEVHTR